MAAFIEDLRSALEYTSSISRERSQNWRTNVSPLLDWQSQAFSSLVRGRSGSEINSLWQSLYENDATHEQAELLHSELKAIIEFQSPLTDPTYKPDEVREDGEPEPPRRLRPLKRAIDLMHIFLESLKEILGDLLGIKGKAALQIAIEAAKAFA